MHYYLKVVALDAVINDANRRKEISRNIFIIIIQEWMIDNVVVPAATVYGLADEYKYLKSSIQEFLTGKCNVYHVLLVQLS